jgi:acetyl esterase/lipase
LLLLSCALHAACASAPVADAARADAGTRDTHDTDKVRLDTASDVPPDRGVPASGALELVPVSSREVADCFPGLKRGPLRERVFSYKRVHAQVIDGVPRELHLRAYVLTPPGFVPRIGASLPVIAMFHGGGWFNGTPVLWIPEARYLAARGIIAVVFQYRLG